MERQVHRRTQRGSSSHRSNHLLFRLSGSCDLCPPPPHPPHPTSTTNPTFSQLPLIAATDTHRALLESLLASKPPHFSLSQLLSEGEERRTTGSRGRRGCGAASAQRQLSSEKHTRRRCRNIFPVSESNTPLLPVSGIYGGMRVGQNTPVVTGGYCGIKTRRTCREAPPPSATFNTQLTVKHSTSFQRGE